MKKNTLLILLLLIISFNSIAQIKIAELNPTPNINLPNSEIPLVLSLSESITNEIVIPRQNGINKGEIEDWRKSLENGFKNGFGDFFNVIPSETQSNFILKISKADIEFIPAAVSGAGMIVGINSQLTYRAEWINDKGEVIKRMAGTAISKNAATRKKQVPANVEASIESMYEQIANKITVE